MTDPTSLPLGGHDIPPPNIYQRILAVTEEVRAFVKDSKNTQFNFRYAGIEQIVATIQPICIKHGVCLIQEAVLLPPQENENKSGKVILAAVNILLHAINVDNPDDRVTVHMPATGFDTLDKAIYKAESGGRKYAIFGMFNLMAGDDDPEHDRPKTKTASKPRSAEPPRQRPSQPAGPAVPVHAEEKRAKATGGRPSSDDDVRNSLIYRKHLMPDQLDWPPKNDADYDIGLNEKQLDKPIETKHRKALLTVVSESGYGSDDDRHELFYAIYSMFRVPERNQVTSTEGMKMAHFFLLINTMKHQNFRTKAADAPLPWRKPKAEQVPDDIGAKEAAAMDPDLDRDIDLEEDEDFFID